MKCATEGCLKEAWSNQEHCQRCVRSDLGLPAARSAKNIPSETTGASTSMVLGGRSLQPLEKDSLDLNRFARDTVRIQSTGSEKSTESSIGTVKIGDELMKSAGRAGMISPMPPKNSSIEREPNTRAERESSDFKSNVPGTTLIENSTSKTLAPAATEELHTGSQQGQLLSFVQEEYVQTSLVDDSIKRLHLQMKRLTLSAESPII